MVWSGSDWNSLIFSVILPLFCLLQLDKFIALDEQVGQWETFQDFNVWLRLNKKGFKNAVLNQVGKWISLFKLDLIDRVKNSLKVSLAGNKIVRQTNKQFVKFCFKFVSLHCFFLGRSWPSLLRMPMLRCKLN